MAAGAARTYRYADVVLIRATTDPGGLALPDDVDLFGDAVAERGGAWLARVWRREEIREAVQLASPVLARQVHQALAGRPDARQVRRVVVSLADAAWLGAVVGRLERHPGLLERLPVVVNGAAFVRGDRLVIPCQPPGERPGEFAPLEVSVRYTRPVHAALQAAREPVGFGELARWLSAAYPATARVPGAAVADRMRAVCDAAEQPLIVDVGLDCDIAVPGPVICEA